jgi:spore germination protein KA
MSFIRIKRDKKELQPKYSSKALEEANNTQINSDLQTSFENIKKAFHKDMDFSYRKFHLFGKIPAIICYFSSIVNVEKIDRTVIKPLQKSSPPEEKSKQLDYIVEDVLYHSSTEILEDYKQIFECILQGKVIVFIDGESHALALDAFEPEKRSIEQPETERVVRGPKDGFIEQLQTNIALLRYRLPVPEFRIEKMEVGERTKTNIVICYLDDVVNPELLDEVKKRINKINIDRVLDAGYIEQFIQDTPNSPFPQVQNTERPDKVVGNILEGRIAILVNGTPFALIVPAVFNQFYHTSEDYNERWLSTSIVRIFRLVALIFSLTFSSFYVTVLSFHPEMIPASFVVAASSGRAGVPFPVFFEVLLMEFSMEILREATVRMPQQVGGALSIVGVLVVGQAAVQAGFVSPITVVIIAMSTISSFATPSYNAATAFRLLRFPLIILSGCFGLLGLAAGIMFVTNHMIGLRSFGVPYMAPIAPLNFQALKDSVIRAPLSLQKFRPFKLHPKDKRRSLSDKLEKNSTSGGGDKGEKS